MEQSSCQCPSCCLQSSVQSKMYYVSPPDSNWVMKKDEDKTRQTMKTVCTQPDKVSANRSLFANNS